MASISRAVANGARLAIPLIVAALFSACRTRGPEVPATPRRDTSAAAVEAQSNPLPDSTTISSPSAVPSTGASPAAPSPGLSPGWKRTELVDGVQSFVRAIDSGDEKLFWSSLSDRSRKMVDGGGLGPRAEIWENAKSTLGDIRDRKITVIGGTPDSVALRIDGERMVEGARENDPIIIGLLREGNGWKVMYPGLLYPEHHLRR